MAAGAITRPAASLAPVAGGRKALHSAAVGLIPVAEKGFPPGGDGSATAPASRQEARAPYPPAEPKSVPIPPSTRRSTPVTKPAASEARNSAASATSQAVP